MSPLRVKVEVEGRQEKPEVILGKLVIVAVWITSAVYSVPKFIFVRTITNNLGDDQLETICIVNRKAFNSELFDIINFALLYLLPLLVMTILYSRIAIALWKSSRGLERHIALQNTTSSSYSNNFHRKPSSKYEKRAVGVTESQVSVESDKVVVTTWRSQNSFHQQRHHGTQLTQVSHSSNNVLRARRGVIRMLMVVVLTFALCNLPFHARKMWQYWPAKPIIDFGQPIAPAMTLLNQKKNDDTPNPITTTSTQAVPSASTTTTVAVPSASTTTSPSVSTPAPISSTTVAPSASTTTTKQTVDTNTNDGVLDALRPGGVSEEHIDKADTDAMDAEISELDRQTLLKRTKSSSPVSSEGDAGKLGGKGKGGKGKGGPTGEGDGFIPVPNGKRNKKKKTT
ncbi:hypothetical protein pipiens_012741 [Culex pipiens pipiens]|uniref:G-protein coupled receptors family 1 profile domain-containing protein n=2 Tax=Culex pipiens pipiens TaxID=38569 RepID=A0ABD1D136_CULPP